MSSFLGKFDYSIDAKGRVNFPAKFRKLLNPQANETIVVCRAPDKCLRAYPKDIWDKRAAEIASWPETPENLRHKRQLFSTSSETTFDAQGRITLSPDQMTIAGIVKEVTLVGYPGYVEIWNTGKYLEYLNKEDDFDEVFYKAMESRSSGK